MESNTLLQKLSESNLDDLEKLQQEYENQESDEKGSYTNDFEELGLAELFDLEEIFVEGETIGNEILKEIHPKLGFHPRIVDIHARGSAKVLKHNFKILQKIEENPEASMGALTALMLLYQVRTFRKLQASGEIAKKVDNDEV